MVLSRLKTVIILIMELSERLIRTLEAEGYEVYEQQETPAALLPKECNETDVAYLVTDGSMVFDFSGKKQSLKQQERLDIKAGIEYTILVGDEGVIYIRGDK
jgi:hypothetical protein